MKQPLEPIEFLFAIAADTPENRKIIEEFAAELDHSKEVKESFEPRLGA